MSNITDREEINRVAMEFLAPELQKCKDGPAGHVAGVVGADLAAKEVDSPARSA
jgi:hypothetical protein